MRNFIICFLLLSIFAQPFLSLPVSAKQLAKVTSYELQSDSFVNTKVQELNEEQKVYVRISKRDLRVLRRQALLSASLLRRIRDLERLYKSISSIVDTIVNAIKLIKNFVNFDDLDFDLSGSGDDFEHVSGVVMSPGYVEFEAKLAKEAGVESFDELGLDSLFFDLYFNRNIFTIDHIEGDGVFGDDYKSLSLPSKTRAAKARIELPLSDVLADTVKFKVYLAPANSNTIKTGNKTKLKIKYYKRKLTDSEGNKYEAINYDYAEGSAQEIEVKVK